MCNVRASPFCSCQSHSPPPPSHFQIFLPFHFHINTRTHISSLYAHAHSLKTIKMRWVVHLIQDYLLNATWNLQLTLIFGVYWWIGFACINSIFVDRFCSHINSQRINNIYTHTHKHSCMHAITIQHWHRRLSSIAMRPLFHF